MSSTCAQRPLTCIACQIVFASAELQRNHYKSDWHRYNLKRKVADLKPVSFDVFANKLTKVPTLGDPAEHFPGFCTVCKKSFGTPKSFENHLNSIKHKLAVEATGELKQATAVESKKIDHVILDDIPSSDITADEIGDEFWSTDSEDDENDTAKADGYAEMPSNTCCLFCPHPSQNVAVNLQHMSSAHGFFVVDGEYCVDVDGLVLALAEKIGGDLCCLWCNKRFCSLIAVQRHSRDKGHCKLCRDDDGMLEFSDFYDFRKSYPKPASGKGHSEKSDDDESDEELEVDDKNVMTDGYDLILPSGATVGHRSLFRYYRQNLKPSSQLAVVRNGKSSRQTQKWISEHGRMLGWTGCTNPKLAWQKSKDMKQFKKFSDKKHLGVGVRANKLQRYFKHQYAML